MDKFDNRLALGAVVFCSITFWFAVFSGKVSDYSMKVAGSGMNPTLQQFDYLKLEKTTDLGRGDIAVYRSPVETLEGWRVPRVLLARIVAVEKESVEIRDGTLLVDGREVAEPYVHNTREFSLSPPQSVPLKHFLVPQDTRPKPLGSHRLGPVPRSNIIGRVSRVYKRSQLYGTGVIEYYTGAMLLVVLFVIPIVLYPRVASVRIAKWFVLLQSVASGLLLFCMGLVMTYPEKFSPSWMMPIVAFHDIERILKFVAFGSEFASFLTMLLIWVSGIVPLLLVWDIYKQNRTLKRMS